MTRHGISEDEAHVAVQNLVNRGLLDDDLEVAREAVAFMLGGDVEVSDEDLTAHRESAREMVSSGLIFLAGEACPRCGFDGTRVLDFEDQRQAMAVCAWGLMGAVKRVPESVDPFNDEKVQRWWEYSVMAAEGDAAFCRWIANDADFVLEKRG